MAGFLYFIEGGKRDISKAKLRELGLGHVADCLYMPCETHGRAAGPGGKPGVVLAARPVTPGCNPARSGYYPAQQIWRAGADGKYWIGYETDNPPRPLDLLRKKIIPGHPVEMANGDVYIVPMARKSSPEGFTACLPCVFDLAPDGRVSGHVAPTHETLDRLAEDLFFDFQVELGVEKGPRRYTSVEQLFLMCEIALGVNYSISRWEMVALGLLGTDAVREIKGAIFDYPGYLTMIEALGDAKVKKNPARIPAGLSGDSGRRDGSATTGPPTPTS